MTYRELLQKEHPESVDERYIGGCESCPSNYGYEADNANCPDDVSGCTACWDRQIPGSEPVESGGAQTGGLISRSALLADLRGQGFLPAIVQRTIERAPAIDAKAESDFDVADLYERQYRAIIEDICCTEEEINELLLKVATLETIESMYDGLGHPDHLRELVQAEQDGKLVVLPCKVGDTVYETDGIRVYPSKITKLIYDTEGIAFDDRAIGESVFLTREEAEAKLKGGDGNA